MLRLLVFTCILLAASACGQKGALYLPEGGNLVPSAMSAAIASGAL